MQTPIHHRPTAGSAHDRSRANAALRILVIGALVAAISVTSVAGDAAPAAALTTAGGTPWTAEPPSSLASFEGGWLDLSVSWGEAAACFVTTTATRCYRSEAEMDAAEGLALPGGPADLVRDRRGAPSVQLLLTCSTTLRLYRLGSYGGAVLALNVRGAVLDLSTYGFDNDTSSYKTGACSATFWENAGGGGSVYPGLTVANVSSPSMVAGWDNRVSSVSIA